MANRAAGCGKLLWTYRERWCEGQSQVSTKAMKNDLAWHIPWVSDIITVLQLKPLTSGGAVVQLL